MAAKRILLAPLDWGYGHATRCIPIARELITQGAEVLIGGTAESRKRILLAVPGLEEVELPGYDISYSKTIPAWLKTGLSIRRIFRAIAEEKKALQQLIRSRAIHGVISDNRYGLYHEAVKSIIITHQLHPVFPRGLRTTGQIMNHRLHRQLSRFSQVWIPDEAPETGILPIGNLSGGLSYPLPKGLNVEYTGLLSRFEPINRLDSVTQDFDLVVVASGPSPQREEFIRLSNHFVQNNKLKAAWLLPDTKGIAYISAGNGNIFVAPDDNKFLEVLSWSASILCRSGYSSLSDWLVLKRGAILVPTPGQTEQEYLAQRLSVVPGFKVIRQGALSASTWQMEGTTPEGENASSTYTNERLAQLIAAFLIK
ncbi:MAG: hypothetical protein K1X77_01330 [Bacteroidia bacterium]|nr:hypothetical protein [Bacteroidia bacterium]